MKKLVSAGFVLLVLFALSGCGGEQEQVLTLETVINLLEKGEKLDWSDFAQYPSEEVGFGLCILHYAIDEDFYLLIGGARAKTEKPWYVHLVSARDREDFIDVRTGDVQAFISERTGA